MFIEEFMCYIWKSESEEFRKMYQEMIKIDTYELFNMACQNKMGLIRYPNLNMNLLGALGCPHRFNKGQLAGCTMCDYQSSSVASQALMTALREKQPDLYAKAIRMHFENVRGHAPEPEIIELISGYDSLNPMEFPDEVYEELFGKHNLFKRKPFQFIFEVRASSVTKDNIDRLKRYLGGTSRITIEFGVEVGNEWLRNHWLNKNITNGQIVTAIDTIHEAGYKATADVLIGIPGLTEEQSLQVFYDTIDWLEDLHVDYYTCVPLNRKKRTLQGFLYEKLKYNETLSQVGISQGEHTGLPWLFTVINAIYMLVKNKPDILKKVNLAQLNATNNTIYNEIAYNGSINCDCVNRIKEILLGFQARKNPDIIVNSICLIQNDPCYKEYLLLIDKQRKSGNVSEVIYLIAQEISKLIWVSNWTDLLKGFKNEIEIM